MTHTRSYLNLVRGFPKARSSRSIGDFLGLDRGSPKARSIRSIGDPYGAARARLPQYESTYGRAPWGSPCRPPQYLCRLMRGWSTAYMGRPASDSLSMGRLMGGCHAIYGAARARLFNMGRLIRGRVAPYMGQPVLPPASMDRLMMGERAAHPMWWPTLVPLGMGRLMGGRPTPYEAAHACPP